MAKLQSLAARRVLLLKCRLMLKGVPRKENSKDLFQVSFELLEMPTGRRRTPFLPPPPGQRDCPIF